MYNENWQEDVKEICKKRLLFHESLQLGELYAQIGKAKVNSVVVRWFIEELLQYTEKEVYAKLDATVFKKYGFKSFLDKQYNGTVYFALHAAYPHKYLMWKLKSLPRGAWENLAFARAALKQWIEDEMKWDDVAICQNFTLKQIRKSGKYGRRMCQLIETAHESDPMKALQDVYPHKFRRGRYDKIELR